MPRLRRLRAMNSKLRRSGYEYAIDLPGLGRLTGVFARPLQGVQSATAGPLPLG